MCWCLRLYDTPVGVATRSAKDAPMPAVSAGSVPMIRWALWLLGGLLLGGIVHLATVLLLPRTATQDAYTRLSADRAGQHRRAAPRRRPRTTR